MPKPTLLNLLAALEIEEERLLVVLAQTELELYRVREGWKHLKTGYAQLTKEVAA